MLVKAIEITDRREEWECEQEKASELISRGSWWQTISSTVSLATKHIALDLPPVVAASKIYSTLHIYLHQWIIVRLSNAHTEFGCLTVNTQNKMNNYILKRRKTSLALCFINCSRWVIRIFFFVCSRLFLIMQAYSPKSSEVTWKRLNFMVPMWLQI